MLYLAQPFQRLSYNTLITESLLEVVLEHEGDLSKLDWEPSERSLTDDLLAIALRCGIAVPGGIVIRGRHVSMEARPRELLKAHHDAQSAQDAVRRQQGALMEHLIPGWDEHGRKLDAEIAKGTERSVNEARSRIAELLATRELDPALVAHWQRLGGQT